MLCAHPSANPSVLKIPSVSEAGLPERRDSHSSEILIPAARQPFDLSLAFLEWRGGGEVDRWNLFG